MIGQYIFVVFCCGHPKLHIRPTILISLECAGSHQCCGTSPIQYEVGSRGPSFHLCRNQIRSLKLPLQYLVHLRERNEYCLITMFYYGHKIFEKLQMGYILTGHITGNIILIRTHTYISRCMELYIFTPL